MADALRKVKNLPINICKKCDSNGMCKPDYPLDDSKRKFFGKNFNFSTKFCPNFLTHGSLDSLPSNSSDDEDTLLGENISSHMQGSVFDIAVRDINNNKSKSESLDRTESCQSYQLSDENQFQVFENAPSPCEDANDISSFRSIFCHGPLLEAAQNANIYEDSKSFVDSKLKSDADVVLREFDDLQNETSGNPTDKQIKDFVDHHFDPPGSLEDNTSLELDKWTPSDWTESPDFLNRISDQTLRSWASDLNVLWTKLGCQIKDDVRDHNANYSMIYSPNHIIVPGGRFREFYYWDNYWIVRGLLLSEMYDTVKGSIRNLLALVNEYGFVPNGGRIYYTGRSQPPFLTLMVQEYVNKTDDTAFLDEALPTLQREYEFWMESRSIPIEDSQGNVHKMNRYASKTNQPRPESYREDFDLTSGLDEASAQDLMSHITSACESGWDFSSRWTGLDFTDNSEVLPHLKTRDIIPVDLNSILALVERTLSEFYSKTGNMEKTAEFTAAYEARVSAIENILWNEEDGTYYDLVMSKNMHNRQYFASNVNPLWTKCYAPSVDVEEREQRLYDYLKSSTGGGCKSVLEFPGGIPTSLHDSGEQWDFPNAWPPLVHMIIEGLATSGSTDLQNEAMHQAQKWITSNWRGYNQSNNHWMFEKYNVTRDDGVPGEGGEYNVQAGFGWTNGVVMSLLERYGNVLTAEPVPDPVPTTPPSVDYTTSSTERYIGSVSTTLTASLAIASFIND